MEKRIELIERRWDLTLIERPECKRLRSASSPASTPASALAVAKQLVENGALVTTGQKRGTRYQVRER